LLSLACAPGLIDPFHPAPAPGHQDHRRARISAVGHVEENADANSFTASGRKRQSASARTVWPAGY
jgi:hypothetical protein